MLELRMNERQLPPEKREDLLNELAKKETEFIRLRRLRLTKNQFESIRIIGRGAFGEVYNMNNRLFLNFWPSDYLLQFDSI
jgi:hypothetical protein